MFGCNSARDVTKKPAADACAHDHGHDLMYVAAVTPNAHGRTGAVLVTRAPCTVPMFQKEFLEELNNS